MRMMRFVIAFGIAWGMQAGVSFAEADWLDRLSGPGPFGGFNYSYRFLCMTTTGDQPDFGAVPDATKNNIAEIPEKANRRLKFGQHGSIPLLWSREEKTDEEKKSSGPTLNNVPAEEPAKARALEAYKQALNAYRREQATYFCHNDQYIRAYLAATYRHNGNDKHSAYRALFNLFNGRDKSRVQIETLEVGYVRRVGPFDLSETFGINYFHGPGFKRFWRGSATPAVGFSPFAILSDRPAARFATFWISGHTFFDGFDSSDFCRNEQTACEGITPFNTSTEIVPRFSLVLNPSVLPFRPFRWPLKKPKP